MSSKDGLNFDEELVDSAVISNFKVIHPDRVHVSEGFANGELILTQKGLVFLEAKGLLKKSLSRHHSYTFDQITGVRTESKGLTGSLIGQEFLIVDFQDSRGTWTFKYSCQKTLADRFAQKLQITIKWRSALKELRKELLTLVKARGEIELREISRMISLKNIFSEILGEQEPSENKCYNLVREEIQTLISDGLLDGLIDSSGKYVSQSIMSRKSIQYQVSIDFSSLYSQLKTKGVVLETIECPSCKGKLEYPESGSVLTCRYCGATVSAVDVFEKFKGLLDL